VLDGLSNDDPRERVVMLEVLSEDPTGSPDVLDRVRELMADETPTVLSLRPAQAAVYGEVRYAAARALAAEHRAGGVGEPVVLADVPSPLDADQVATLRDRAGMRSLGPLDAYAELRQRGLIPSTTVRLDPAVPVDGTGVDLVELTGRALDFADRARATMCAEFGVRHVSEVAMLARLRRIERRGTCRDGLRYDIHGNGYDVYATGTAWLTIQGHGFANVERPAGADAGVYDYVDLYALRDFLRDWAATTTDLDALAGACAEHCRRGALRDAGDRRYELIRTRGDSGAGASGTVPGHVEEGQ
jgi:hypothetical protein